MYMVEISEDKYSKIAKAIKCMIEKSEYLKELFDDDLDFRKRDRYEDDYEDHRPYKRGRFY